MTLMSNLVRAEMAVAYVDSVMKWPSGNKRDDVKHRQMYGLPYPDVKCMRDEFNAVVASRKLWHWYGHPSNNVEHFLTEADFAQEYGVGACDELTAVAFKWLVEVHQAPCNVSRYSLGNGRKFFHAFLLLGEQEPNRIPCFIDETHWPATWSSDAVWCDPWRRDWFAVKNDWRRRIGMIARDCDPKFVSPTGFYSVRCEAFSPATDRSQWRRIQSPD